MGLAYYIVLHNNINEINTEMDGKSLAGSIELIDNAAAELGVKPLSDFISSDPKDVAFFTEEEGLDPDELDIPPLRLFYADEGLNSVRALLEHPTVKNKKTLINDLNNLKRVLESADANNVMWYLAIDF